MSKYQFTSNCIGRTKPIAADSHSTSTCRYDYHKETLELMPRTADCWTAQHCVVPVLADIAVEHWTLPDGSSLVVCCCRGQRSAHCRHRHRHWCVDRLTDLRHHFHVRRMSAATRRSVNKPWWCRLQMSNIWADFCWCSVLEGSFLFWIRGRWIWFLSIFAMMCRDPVETLVSGSYSFVLHRLDPDARRRSWNRRVQCHILLLQHC